MTIAVTVASAEKSVDPEELRANLRKADAGILVAVLAQLTGDPGVADRYAAKISFTPDPPEQVGTTDPETLETLVEAVTAALAATPTQSAVPDGQGGGGCGSTFSHTPPLTGLGNMLMLMAPLGLVVVMRRVRRNR